MQLNGITLMRVTADCTRLLLNPSFNDKWMAHLPIVQYKRHIQESYHQAECFPVSDEVRNQSLHSNTNPVSHLG